MDPSSLKPHRKIAHPLKKIVLGLLGVTLVLFIALTTWGVRRYDRLIESGKAIERRYSELAASLPFSPPATPPSTDRLERMLAIRQQTIQSLPPELVKNCQRLFADHPPRKTDLARLALTAAPDLQRIAMEMADHLQQAAMSPEEYRWLLGSLVAEALRPGAGHPVGNTYRHVAQQLAGLGERLAQSDHAIPPIHDLTSIEQTYGPHRPADPALADRLQADPLICGLDLLVLTIDGDARQ